MSVGDRVRWDTPGCQGLVTHAAEWLLDNFYLIEEQIQMARRHLPRGYSRELPRLLNGPSAGLPRVYDLVLELISHVDAQIDAELASQQNRVVVATSIDRLANRKDSK